MLTSCWQADVLFRVDLTTAMHYRVTFLAGWFMTCDMQWKYSVADKIRPILTDTIVRATDGQTDGRQHIARCAYAVCCHALIIIAIWHSFAESVVEPLITNVVAMLTCRRHVVKVISTVWLIDRRILVTHSHWLHFTVFDWCTCVRDGWTDDSIIRYTCLFAVAC